MKGFLFWSALQLFILFFVWYRKPAGRSGRSEPEFLRIKGLRDFDVANPNASNEIREAFYDAVQAHLGNDLNKARQGYKRILGTVGHEPTVEYNLQLLERKLSGDR